ncbi:MAG: M48 family metalloprotease [Candidatus Hadarchaeum sp.]
MLSALAQQFRPEELLFVLGHELGHMKPLHATWLTLMDRAGQQGARFILAPLARLVFNLWSVKAEYTADEAGLFACRQPKAGMRALLRIAGGGEDAFMSEIEAIARDKSDKQGLLSDLADFLGTHPAIQKRLKHIQDFGHSSLFRRAIKA